MNVLTTTTSTVEIFSTTISAGSGSTNAIVHIPQLKFVVFGILGSILFVIGFLGNILSMIVLQQRQMRSSTSYYLLSLAIYDNGVLLGMLVYFTLPNLPISTEAKEIIQNSLPIGYPLCLTAQMGSIYTCVGFTIERFVAVCRPLHVANTCTKSRALRAICLIFVWCVAYNIPRFFQYHIKYITPDDSSVNNTTPTLNITFATMNSQHAPYPSPSVSSNVASEGFAFPGYNPARGINGTYSLLGDLKEKLAFNFERRVEVSRDTFFHNGSAIASSLDSPTSSFSRNPTTPSASSAYQATSPVAKPRRASLVETAFGEDPSFKHIYILYSYLCFMFMLPFVVILVMNVYLINAVNKSRSTRQSLSTSASKEQNLTVMLIAVIVVFLVCQFPTIIDNILLAVLGQVKLNTIFSYQVFYITVTFMVEINHAANFILYCFFGKKFRMVLLAVVGLKKRRKHVAYRSTVFKSRAGNGTKSYDTEVSTL